MAFCVVFPQMGIIIVAIITWHRFAWHVTTATTVAWKSAIFLPRMASAAKPALTKLFVARLPWITCGESLWNHFKQFGPLKETRVVFDINTGRSKKFGFVVYKDKSSADNALSQSSHIVDGKQLAVLLSDVPAKDRDLDENSS